MQCLRQANGGSKIDSSLHPAPAGAISIRLMPKMGVASE